MFEKFVKDGEEVLATDNGVRPEDGEQDVSQSPDDDYSLETVEEAGDGEA